MTDIEIIKQVAFDPALQHLTAKEVYDIALKKTGHEDNHQFLTLWLMVCSQ